MQRQVFGRYRIVDSLAEGGMAKVWTARHELSGREAVIKLLRPEMAEKEQFIKRFIQEAQAASRITDPGIVQVLDVGYEQGFAYLVLERLVGETLGQRLEKSRTLPWQKALLLMRQLVRAMGAAHEVGIVHRDLKPDNLFLVHDPEVSGQERIKVLDFGLAKLACSAASVRTAQGTVFGTPAYMAPEQCLDSGTVDHRADLYSIGCVFFRCLSGWPPFGSGGPDVLWAQLRNTPVLPEAVKKSVPGSVQAVIMRLLAKSPEQRFGSCRDLLAALDEVEVSAEAHCSGDDGTTSLDLPRVSTPAGMMDQGVMDLGDVTWIEVEPELLPPPPANPLLLRPLPEAALPQAVLPQVPQPPQAPLPLPRLEPHPLSRAAEGTVPSVGGGELQARDPWIATRYRWLPWTVAAALVAVGIFAGVWMISRREIGSHEQSAQQNMAMLQAQQAELDRWIQHAEQADRSRNGNRYCSMSGMLVIYRVMTRRGWRHFLVWSSWLERNCRTRSVLPNCAGPSRLGICRRLQRICVLSRHRVSITPWRQPSTRV